MAIDPKLQSIIDELTAYGNAQAAPVVAPVVVPPVVVAPVVVAPVVVSKPTPSPDKTQGSSIVDAEGNLWKINAAAQITLNGTIETLTQQVDSLIYLAAGDQVWQHTTFGDYYQISAPKGVFTTVQGPTTTSPLGAAAIATGGQVGLGTYNIDSVARAAAMYGRPIQFFTTYVNSQTEDPSGWAGDCGYQAGQMNGNALLNAASGVTPVCAWGFGSNGTSYVDAVANGTYDSQITGGVAAWASAGFKRVIFRVSWEMNGTWFPWNAANNANYVASWQHFVTVARAEAAKHSDFTVLFNWCPNVNQANDVLLNIFPGKEYVDILGIDIYDAPIDGGNPPGKAASSPSDWQVTTMIEWAKQYDLPFAFDEIGITTTSFANALVTCLQGRDQSTTCLYVGLWDVDVDGNFQVSGGANPAVAAIMAAAFGPNGTVKNPT